MASKKSPKPDAASLIDGIPSSILLKESIPASLQALFEATMNGKGW